MSASRWANLMARMNRSSQLIRDNTARSTFHTLFQKKREHITNETSVTDPPLPLQVIAMDGVNEPSRAPKTLLTFNTREDLQNYALGVDSDIGGTSTARLDFTPDEGSSGEKGKSRFWGNMRLGVRSDLQGRIRGGYAGFRSKVRCCCVIAKQRIF